MESSSPIGLASFPLFTHLPTELRLKIYTLSLASPRVVPLNYFSSTADSCRQITRSHGCTSPSPIPALLHTSHEARTLAQEYYTLSFNLDGPTHMFPPKIWFSNGKGHDDVLYFGPQAGHLGSFKHFVRVMTVLDPSEMLRVRKLAVHEELFLQTRRESGPFDCNPNASRSKDALTERCLRDFWEHVRRKFSNVEEVCIVGADMEHEISRCGFGWTETQMALEMPRQKVADRHHESLHAKVARAVGELAAEDGAWMVPRWRILTFQDRVVGGRKARSCSGRKVRRLSSGEMHLVEKM